MKLKIILLTLTALIIILSLTCGILHYKTAQDSEILENHQRVSVNVANTVDNIVANLAAKNSAISRLAAIKSLENVLLDSSTENIHWANDTLDDFGSAFYNSVFYLMDTAGDTVASSNRNSPESFVGQNYGFRPYFQDAIRGKPSQFIGIGVTSKKPGVYLSHPIYGREKDQIIGVVAGKFSFADILAGIKRAFPPGIAVLSGPDNIILLSNHAELVGQFLWLPSAEVSQTTGTNNQFSAGPWTGLKKISPTQAVNHDGHSFTIHTSSLESSPGWNLTFLHDDTAFIESLSVRLARTIGISLIGILIVMGLLVILLYSMASREIEKRKAAEKILIGNQEQLEIQIEERTQELLAINRKLSTEFVENTRVSKELEQSNKTLEILNKVLRISQKTQTLQEFMHEFLKYISSFTNLDLLPKGALFLVDDANPATLLMKAQYNLDNPLPEICNLVPFGHCLCGRAAFAGKTIFAGSIDERHDNTYEGIHPHGHYCVPIMSKSNVLLGVYNVYTNDRAVYDKQLANLLESIAALLANIIEYKKVEQKSRESHEKHRAITNTTTDSIIMADHQGRISFWNPAAEKLFGFTREEALAQKIHDLIAPENLLEKANLAFADFVTTGAGPLIGKTIEVMGVKKSGEEFPLELSLSSVRQGNNWAAIGILRDITERKSIEEEKFAMEQQLLQAQKMEALGTLAGGIAHDFNNILSSILGYAELIRDDMPPNSNESLADIDKVIRAGNRARELVKQILLFSRQTEHEIQPVQVSLVIKEALKMLRASLPANIEIKQMISAGATTVLSDPSHIHQLIMNLCTNSYKAMRGNDDGGTLTVRLENFRPDDAFIETHPDLQNNQYLRLTVSDTGHGIPSAIIPRIFDPYFSTNKKEDGTGLGLAVVHGIISRLGGIIEVNSKLDAGTTFEIYLPIVDNLVHDQQVQKNSDTRGSETILLVDDELPILQLEERILTSLGYKTFCRTSSIEALELFRNQPDKFDLIVTDHSMPNMTGARMAEEIAKLRPGIPIILCSGYSEVNLTNPAGKNCISRVIMKPVNKAELAQSIREVLGGGNNGQPPARSDG